jgi:steroid 5-alpha reductase family enzyme
MNSSILLAAAIATLVLMLSTWLVSLIRKDASVVDIVWGLGFVVVAWVARFVGHGSSTRQMLLTVCTTLWGVRLAGYLAWRNLGKGEDYRYRTMRKKFGDRFPIVSLRTVFLTQGVLMWIVSMPVQFGQMHGGRDGVDAWIIAGFVLWAVGLAFESIGDIQLARFKAVEANKGTVMNRGLWAWTRHPNYFGDSCVWWGLWLMASSAPIARWTVFGPIAMTFLLVRVSGVAMLEKTIGRRRPGYDEYIRTTSAFLPRPPKRLKTR